MVLFINLSHNDSFFDSSDQQYSVPRYTKCDGKTKQMKSSLMCVIRAADS